MNISEFERTKPVGTLKKINNVIHIIQQRQTDVFFGRDADEQLFLASLLKLVNDLKESFKKGE